jgi:RHS repeat-associated protein
MKLVHGLALLAAALVGTAEADTPSQVWNVTVAMTVPGGGANPLQGQVFKHFGKALPALRGAHADAVFLVQKEQTAGNAGANIVTKFWIPPASVADWGAWTYSGDSVVWNSTTCNGPFTSEQQIIDCTLNPRNPCGISTYVPTSGWTLVESATTYQKERRNYELAVYMPTYQSGVGYVCGPYQGPTTSASIVERWRYKVCPAAAPWYGAPANGSGMCTNALTADVTQTGILGGCVAEPDGRKEVFANPCNAATGDKLEAEPDYAGAGLELTRYYHSNSEFRPLAGLGEHWTHNYAKKLRFRTASSNTVPIVHIGADGNGEVLAQDYYGWIGERSGVHVLQSGTEWELHRTDGGKERYAADGKLLWIETAVGQRTTLTYGTSGLVTVTGPFGHALQFAYTDAQISSVTDPDGGTYQYAYNSAGMLSSVTYPDSTTRVYHYEDSNNAYGLTGITDENGDRYSTFAYNTDGLVTSTQHAGGYGAHTLTYNADTSTTVTDARGTTTTYQFASMLSNGSAGRRRPTSFATGGQAFTRSYLTGQSSPHRVASAVDENGATTTFSYNNYPHRLASKTDASGTTYSRTTTYTYLNTTRHLMTQVATPSIKTGSLRKIITAYDSEQRPQTITLSGFQPASAGGAAVSRVVTLSYNSYDQVTQINGPRTDVSDIITLDYYECTTGGACGQLEALTNALGHVTTFDAYDDHGRLLQTTDANGVETEYVYDLRGRVTSVTETPPYASPRVTTFVYDDAGQLTSVEAPNGVELTYAYDEAHNLLSITDNLGNSIEYGYDLAGNRTSEDVYDESSALKKAVDYTYDLRNRPDAVNAAGSVTDLVFDAVGNLTDETDPNSSSSDHTFDKMNRLTSTIDALSGATDFTYDKNDFLVSVKAPNNATTTYVYNDLGDLLSMTSPDTGTTTYTYDAAGNRLSQTDARSVTVNYTYDALNRLTNIDYPGSSLDTTFTFDQGTAQKGRLTTMTDGSGTTTFAYDAVGNLTQESKAVDGNTHVTAYGYDTGDLLTLITYPSGRTVEYTRNALGQVTTIESTYDSTPMTVAEEIEYEPFGPLKGLTFGNSLVLARAFDQQYRLTDQTTGSVQDLGFTLDAAGNIDGIADAVNAGRSQGFEQDALHRVTADAGSYGTKNYTYDSVGNRLTRTHSAVTQTLTYTSNSNRLATHDGQTVSLDAVGNTLANPAENLSFTYGAHNRQLEAHVGAVLKATFVYNGQGQRIKKIEATGAQRTFVYHYGLGGELLGETIYSSAGAKIGERDYLWLDSLPLAQSERTFSGGSVTSSNFAYIHADQLNTPRLATNASGTVVWRWDSDAFGLGDADTDPDSDTNLVNIRLRFPGQYLDEETGLHYNYFRDYDPVVGRYIQSDPIGLEGGINAYAYGAGNPLSNVDPLGLFITSVDAACVHDPMFCTEIMGQMVENAGAMSGDTCLAQDAAEAADDIREFGRWATLATLGGMLKRTVPAATRASSAFPRRTLHGVSLNWLKRNKPSGWTTSPTRDNRGFIWKDENGVERLRYMRPSGTNPANSQWSRDASGYLRWQDASGNFLDASGNVVSRSHPRFQELTHIIYEGPR